MFYIKLFIRVFIHSIAICKIQQFLAILRSFFHSSLLNTISCHTSPTNILPLLPTSTCHLILSFPFGLIDSKIIYDTLFRILYPSIKCTCQQQQNPISFNSLYMHKRTKFHFISFSVQPQNNTITFLSILFTSLNKQSSISFHSLYISKQTEFYYFPFTVHP
jgi:hypothetical protein